jgi:hypothetical protein
MNKIVHCSNKGCRGGKVHYLVGFDIFWNDCPICDGLGSNKRNDPDYVIEHQNWRFWSCFFAAKQNVLFGEMGSMSISVKVEDISIG